MVNYNAPSSCHPGNGVQFISVSSRPHYEIPDGFSSNRIAGLSLTVYKQFDGQVASCAGYLRPAKELKTSFIFSFIFSGSTRIFRRFPRGMFIGRVSDGSGTSYITRRFDQKLRTVRYRRPTIYRKNENTVRSSRFSIIFVFLSGYVPRTAISNLQVPSRKGRRVCHDKTAAF